MFLLCFAVPQSALWANEPEVITLPERAPTNDTADRDMELPPIVVTGELLEREATQTSSSVSVHTGAEIERSGVSDIYDLIRSTPNTSLEDNDYGFGGISVRGIGSYGASGAGAYASYGTTSTVVLDGVGLPRSALAYADLSAFDLDSVEIFRGPQSTSQGRNAMAGAIVIRTVAPEARDAFSPEFRARVSAGDFGQRQYAGAIEATMWPDTLALRLTHDERVDDGDIENQTRQEHAARRDARTTRLRGHLRPGGFRGNYELWFGLSDITRFSGSRYVRIEQEQSRRAENDQPQDFSNRAQLFSVEQRLDLNTRWSLRAISAYFESDTSSRFDTDYGAEDGAATRQWEDSHGFSQEIRLNYEGEKLRSSIGAFYSDETNGDDTSGYVELSYLLSSTGLPLGGLPLGRVNFQGANPSQVRDIAIFGEFDWQFSPRWSLIAGMRADREQNSRVISTSYNGNSPASELLVRALAGTVLPADGSVMVDRAFNDLLPKLALRYSIADTWFAGVSYAEGYRPGGDGYNQVSGRYFQFDAERTQTIELSLKGHHPRWRVQTALNLFHTRWSDMQVQGGQGTDTYMENAGLATIRGGELEFRWRPRIATPVQVVGGYAITHGRFDRYTSTQGDDFAGNKLPKAPAYSGVLAVEWSPISDLMIRPDIVWTGSTPANADNNPVHTLISHRLINLNLRWQIGSAQLMLSASNLTNESYRLDANNFGMAGYDVVSLGAGRRIFGGIEVHL